MLRHRIGDNDRFQMRKLRVNNAFLAKFVLFVFAQEDETHDLGLYLYLLKF